ncbi:MAG: hypothetical protein ACE3JQ_09855 [Paenisporosarcina sp.]
MKNLVKLFIVLSFILCSTACSAEPKVSVDEETNDVNPTAIELTTLVEGKFLGFEGENAVNILYDGKETTYEIAEDASGDLDKVKSGDNIAFSTKMVDGKEMIETIRLY